MCRLRKECDRCNNVRKMIDDNRIPLESIQKLIDEKELVLYAANCEPNKMGYWMDRGNHYTINTYYKCNTCERYYYLGFCIYGNPVFKEVLREDVIDGALRMEWGFEGVYFENGVTFQDIKTNYSQANRCEIYEPVWQALIEAYNYGTVTPMHALISVIKFFYQRILDGGFFNIHLKEDETVQMLNKESFDEIIQFYFGEEVLIEAKKD